MRFDQFEDVKLRDDGNWEGIGICPPLEKMTITQVDYATGKEIAKHELGGEEEDQRVPFRMCPHLFLIAEAELRGCSFEEEADGFGPGLGTHGDWSGIRDSSREAQGVMLTKALNFLFGAKRTHRPTKRRPKKPDRTMPETGEFEEGVTGGTVVKKLHVFGAGNYALCSHRIMRAAAAQAHPVQRRKNSGREGRCGNCQRIWDKEQARKTRAG